MGALPAIQRSPSRMSWPMCCSGREEDSSRGSRTLAKSTAASSRAVACTPNGTAEPRANRLAPTAGPMNWFATRKPDICRALPMPRSALGTIIGSTARQPVSANSSATPTANSVTSSSAIDTVPVAMVTTRTASTATRTRFAVSTSRRRSTRSASAPAYRPSRRVGRFCTIAAAAIRAGSRVSEATSSGPAARAIPSPSWPTHDEARFQRNGTPIRAGATHSPRRDRTGVTRARPYPGRYGVVVPVSVRRPRLPGFPDHAALHVRWTTVIVCSHAATQFARLPTCDEEPPNRGAPQQSGRQRQPAGCVQAPGRTTPPWRVRRN